MLKKKLLAVVLAAAMVFTMIPFTALAADEDYSTADEVSLECTETPDKSAIDFWWGDSGEYTQGVDDETGTVYWQTNNEKGAHYVFCNVNDTFFTEETNTYLVEVTYWDKGKGKFTVQWGEPSETAANEAEACQLTDSGKWKIHKFIIEDATQNSMQKADFRVGRWAPKMGGSDEDVCFSKITVKKINDSEQVSAKLGQTVETNGIAVKGGDASDQPTIVTHDGVEAWQTNNASGGGMGCIYFNVDDDSSVFVQGDKNKVTVEIVYFDEGTGDFSLAYNSTDAAWAYLDKVTLTDSKTWKTYSVVLDNAKFGNECNGSDFRIDAWGTDMAFASFSVTKIRAVKISGGTENVGNMFFAGEDVSIDLKLQNDFAVEKTMNVSYDIVDYKNVVVASGSFDATMGAKGSVNKTLELGTFPKGVYHVQLTGSLGEDYELATADVPFSLYEDLSGVDIFDNFGVCTHFSQGKGNMEKLMPLIRNGGAVRIRDEYYWSSVETEKGVYTFPESYDAYIKKAHECGLEPLIILNYGNDLYPDVKTEEGLAGFLGYVEVVVGHLKELGVNSYEIWNEWNSGGTPSSYFTLAKATAEKIREVDPEAFIVAGGALGYDSTWLKSLVDMGICDYTDALSFHPYYFPSNPENGGFIPNYQNLRDYLNQKGVRPEYELWCTETGFPTHDANMGGMSEAMSAACGVQMYVTNLANLGVVDKIFWYDLQNDGTNSADQEHNFGMVSLVADGAAKASYVAFNAAAGMLADTDFVESYNDLATNLRIYKFHKAATNEDILVVWSNKDEIPTGLDLGTENFKVYDLFGNEEVYSKLDGVLSMTVREEPTYIVGNFSKAPVLATPSFNVKENKLEVVPGETVTLQIERTAEAQKVSGEYKVVLPQGWQVVGDTKFAAGSAVDEVTVKVPDDKRDGYEYLSIYPVSGDTQYGFISIQTRMVDGFVVSFGPQLNEEGDGYDLSITLKNQYSSNSVSGGKIVITEPISIAKEIPFTTIGPKSEKNFKVAFPGLNVDQGIPVALKVITDDKSINQEFTRSNMTSFTAVKAVKPIEVDGVIGSEWDGSMTFTVDQENNIKMSSGLPWGGAEDLSATGYAKWDDDYLYLAFDVTDNIFCQPYDQGGQAWQADGIQFMIDPGRSTGEGSRGRSEIGFALSGVTGENMKTVSTSVADLQGINLKNSSAVIKRDDEAKHTYYELAVKWTDILTQDMTPGEGMNIGFSWLANDSDSEDAASNVRRGWVEYMSGIGYGKDPKLFGDLILTERTTMDPTAVEVDKDALRDLLDQAKEIDQSKFTQETVDVLVEAMNTAEDVLNDENATQTQVDSAAKALQSAIDGLVEVGGETSEPSTPVKPTGDASTVLPIALVGFVSLAAAVLIRKKEQKD
jgi:hypothetical protein